MPRLSWRYRLSEWLRPSKLTPVRGRFEAGVWIPETRRPPVDEIDGLIRDAVDGWKARRLVESTEATARMLDEGRRDVERMKADTLATQRAIDSLNVRKVTRGGYDVEYGQRRPRYWMDMPDPRDPNDIPQPRRGGHHGTEYEYLRMGCRCTNCWRRHEYGDGPIPVEEPAEVTYGGKAYVTPAPVILGPGQTVDDVPDGTRPDTLIMRRPDTPVCMTCRTEHYCPTHRPGTPAPDWNLPY